MSEPALEPVTYGCTVTDVLRLLPHVSLGAPLYSAALGEAVLGEAVAGADPYASPMVRRLSEADVEAFIVDVASEVTARIYWHERLDPVVQSHIRVMARNVVANGAAHYVQTAVHPASADPNNGSSYAAMLWERYQSALERVEATIQRELDNPTTPAPWGKVSGSFPAPLFPDDLEF